MDNNAAERALRAVALGRKNYLFAGSDAGGERAAAMYSLIGSAKLNGLDPEPDISFSHNGAEISGRSIKIGGNGGTVANWSIRDINGRVVRFRVSDSTWDSTFHPNL
jgi:hypothetical protein